MKVTQLQSRCECQATLRCQLTQDGRVVSGSAALRGQDESAPATQVGVLAPGDLKVNVGFLCPFCGRNTLRTFDLGAAAFQEA